MKPKEIESRERCLEKHNASLTECEILRLECWKYLAPHLDVNGGNIDRDTKHRLHGMINKAVYDRDVERLEQIRDSLKNR